jgi:hypothetical protein
MTLEFTYRERFFSTENITKIGRDNNHTLNSELRKVKIGIESNKN